MKVRILNGIGSVPEPPDFEPCERLANRHMFSWEGEISDVKAENGITHFRFGDLYDAQIIQSDTPEWFKSGATVRIEFDGDKITIRLICDGKRQADKTHA